jgi:putative ABC transport system ATP-binding protein
MSEVLIEARGVRKAYGRTEALRGTNLEVGDGETIAITGPSGSGKSTLLLSLAGIPRPESGEIRYEGARLDDLREAERTRLRRRHFGWSSSSDNWSPS